MEDLLYRDCENPCVKKARVYNFVHNTIIETYIFKTYFTQTTVCEKIGHVLRTFTHTLNVCIIFIIN